MTKLNLKKFNIFMICFVFCGFLIGKPFLNQPINQKTSSQPILTIPTASYTHGSPIIINGTASYCWEDYLSYDWCSGLGTYVSPYIIENLVLSLPGRSEGISIKDNQSFFVIQNCDIQSLTVAAILLVNVANGTINNSLFTNNSVGIKSYKVSNTTIKDNQFWNNDYGTYLDADNGDRSMWNLLENNTCWANNETGMWINNMNQSQIIDNNCSNNKKSGFNLISVDHSNVTGNDANFNLEYGIKFEVIIGDNISQNTCLNNSESGFYMDWGQNTTLYQNIANGNKEGFTIHGNFDYVHLVNNTANRNTMNGFVQRGANDSMIVDNFASYNGQCGISMVGLGTFDRNITCSNNWAWNNGQVGLFINSIGFHVTNNNFSYNHQYGILIWKSYGEWLKLIKNNTVSYNTKNGLKIGEECVNISVQNLYSMNNGESGILLEGCHNNTINESVLQNNQNYGILARYYDGTPRTYTHDVAIVGVSMIGNTKAGMKIGDQTRDFVIRNSYLDQGLDILAGGQNASSHDIDATNTVSSGVLYYYSNQTGGSVPANAGQVILANTNYTTVNGLNIGNSICAIGLLGAYNNTIHGNQFNSDIIGINLYKSNSNKIYNNYAESCDSGITIQQSSYNNVSDNTFYITNVNGIFLLGSTSNLIAGNNVTNSSNYGIRSVSHWISGTNWKYTNQNQILSNNISYSNVGVELSSTTGYGDIVRYNFFYLCSVTCVNDLGGDHTIDSNYCIKSPLPWIFITSNYTSSIKVGDYIKFNTSIFGVAPYTYQWNFGDGSTNDTTSNPLHQFNINLTVPSNWLISPYYEYFHVILTVVDSKGNLNITRMDIMIVITVDENQTTTNTTTSSTSSSSTTTTTSGTEAPAVTVEETIWVVVVISVVVFGFVFTFFMRKKAKRKKQQPTEITL
jgi:parallel beta-helix repeat protein